MSSLPRYPSEGRPELPPPRRDWGWLAPVGAAVLVGLLLWLGGVFAPAARLLALNPGFATVLAAGLAVCGLVLLAVLAFALQHSKARPDE